MDVAHCFSSSMSHYSSGDLKLRIHGPVYGLPLRGKTSGDATLKLERRSPMQRHTTTATKKDPGRLNGHSCYLHKHRQRLLLELQPSYTRFANPVTPENPAARLPLRPLAVWRLDMLQQRRSWNVA